MHFDHDLLDRATIADPYPLFAELRERAPVHWNDRYASWMVMSYDGVAQGLRHRALSSDRVLNTRSARDLEPRLSAALEVLAGWLVFKDPPDHSRLRRLVLKSFTSNAVARISHRIESLTQELLDGCDARSFDLVEQLAYPLPAIVIAELLGVPAEDRDLFRSWSDDISELVFGSGVRGADRSRQAEAMHAFVDYFSALVDRYEREPADNLLSSLIAARDADDALSHDEVIATAILILFAGHETTTNLIASGLYHLLRTPDQRRRLLDEPGLIERTVEELLRFDGPSKITVRHASEALSIGGQNIEAGSRVFLVQASANRDPAAFERPDSLDIDRWPNPHLGFGHGIHFCVGAPLARFEARVAILAVLQRFPKLRLASYDLDWEPVVLNRGPLSLPVIA